MSLLMPIIFGTISGFVLVSLVGFNVVNSKS